MPASRFLDHAVEMVHVIAAESVGRTLAAAVAAVQNFYAPFSFRDDTKCATLFLLGNESGRFAGFAGTTGDAELEARA